MTDLVPRTPDQINAFLSHAESWLTQTEDPHDLREIQQKTAAIVRLCRTIEDAKEVMNRAAIIRVRAEREIGVWLSQNIKPGGSSMSSVVTLTDMQITRNQSMNWQMVAEIPEERFEEFIDDKVSRGYDITSGALIRYARNVLGRPVKSRITGKVLLLDPSDDDCALQGFNVACREDYPLTTEHIIRRSAYQGGSAELKKYYEDPMNKASTCYTHNVGKWADTPTGVRIMLFQKVYRFGLSAVRDYFNSAPWKVFPHEWGFEAMFDEVFP